jgi:hypothetical protein
MVMETKKKSLINRVEKTSDSVGWMVFFDDNKHQQRILSKYAIEPQPGDAITLFGFPRTYGVKINDNIVFMESSFYISEIHKHANKVQKLEKLLRRTKKHHVKI